MIQRKLYECEFEGCSREVPIRSKLKDGRKVCPSCKQKAEGSGFSNRSRIKPITEKKKEQKKKRKAELDPFFDYHINNCTRSEESGVTISDPTKANICHLFDKGRHSSLMANLDNCIYLTIHEHARFDQLLYSHRFEGLEKTFPNSWGIACRRMKKVLDLCQEKTKFYFKIKEYLNR